MMFRSVAVLIAATGFLISSQAQTISFNSPLPWVTLRNDTLTVRAQIDTAVLKGKKLSMSLLKAGKGKSKTLSRKTFTISDPSGEFSFGNVKKSLLGGESYLKIVWEVKGTEEETKGEIEPIGIADISAKKDTDTLGALRVGDKATAKEIAQKVSKKLAPLGKLSFAFAWNKSKLFIVTKKSTAGDTFTVALDGKCGKNAFLSYPDRCIELVSGEKPEVSGFHYKRKVNDKTMVYERESWNNDITSDSSDDMVVVSMPWFDSGIIPFEERNIGAALFAGSTSGKSIPADAAFFIPATWGIIKLQK